MKSMPKSVISNKYLIFSAIIILIWGVNFTLNTSLMFPVLAINYAIMAFIIFYPLSYERKNVNIKDYWPLILYWAWLAYAAIRGIKDVHSNSTFKFFLDYLLAELLSFFVLLPNSQLVYYKWLRAFWKVGWVVAIILTPFGVNHSFFFHYLILIIPLWKYLGKFEKWLLVCIVIFSLRNLDPRAHVPKYMIEFLIFMLPMSWLKDKAIKFLHPILLLLPFVLLTTGIAGIFNPFDMESYIKTDVKVKQGGETLDATIDTRTVIYEDVINSAVNNDYVLEGRNITNGNDSRFVSYEQRNTNEAAILNHFTKMGLIGIILLFVIFAYASYLAIYKSNNHWVKLVGLYISFRWIMLWVEDIESFSALFLSIWLMLGVCISQNFRRMSDNEISESLKTVLK